MLRKQSPRNGAILEFVGASVGFLAIQMASNFDNAQVEHCEGTFARY